MFSELLALRTVLLFFLPVLSKFIFTSFQTNSSIFNRPRPKSGQGGISASLQQFSRFNSARQTSSEDLSGETLPVGTKYRSRYRGPVKFALRRTEPISLGNHLFIQYQICARSAYKETIWEDLIRP